MKMRLLAALLALVMVFTLLPTAAFAADKNISIEVDSTGNLVASYGDGWSYNSSTETVDIQAGYTLSEVYCLDAGRKIPGTIYEDIANYGTVALKLGGCNYIVNVNGGVIQYGSDDPSCRINSVANNSGGIIRGGFFVATALNSGIISGGQFGGSVVNYFQEGVVNGNISGGLFLGAVTNEGTINSGYFLGGIVNGTDGTIGADAKRTSAHDLTIESVGGSAQITHTNESLYNYFISTRGDTNTGKGVAGTSYQVRNDERLIGLYLLDKEDAPPTAPYSITDSFRYSQLLDSYDFTMPAKDVYVYAVFYTPVTGITGVPTEAHTGVDLPLTGTVAPVDATHSDIAWSVKDAGTTGATITDGVFHATATGTATVTATIANGATSTTPYTQDFTITVTTPTPTITFGTHPQNKTFTLGQINDTLTAEAAVSTGGTATLDWYACDENGTITGSSLARAAPSVSPQTCLKEHITIFAKPHTRARRRSTPTWRRSQ